MYFTKLRTPNVESDSGRRMKKTIAILSLACGFSFTQGVSAADTNLWDMVPFLTCTSGVVELNRTLESTVAAEADIIVAAFALLGNYVPAGVSSLELTNTFRSTSWLRRASIVAEPKPSKVTPSCIIAFTNSAGVLRMTRAIERRAPRVFRWLCDDGGHAS
jgi:hypothetical protein